MVGFLIIGMHPATVMTNIMHQRMRGVQRKAVLQKDGSIPAYGPGIILTGLKAFHLLPEIHIPFNGELVDLLLIELTHQFINVWFKIFPGARPGSPAPTSGGAVKKSLR